MSRRRSPSARNDAGHPRRSVHKPGTPPAGAGQSASRLDVYVEAVKQVEILFALAIGTLLCGEKQKVREIAPGALVMLAGVVLLSLAG